MNNFSTLMTMYNEKYFIIIFIRIYGLHKMRFYKTKNSSEKIYFVVLGNLFKTSLELSLRYDLKGFKKYV